MPSPGSSCVICGGSSTAPLFRPAHSPGPVVRCRVCGLVYVSPIEDDHAVITAPLAPGDDPTWRTTSDIRLLSGCWEATELAERRAEWPALRRNALAALKRIERHRPPPGRLLDIGCGWGFPLGAARERGWKPYSLEPLAGHALYTRATTGAEVLTDVLHDDSFPPSFFDVITAFQVLEHLPDPAGDLQRLYGFLKPGGIVLIEVPNIATWSVALLGSRHRHFTSDHLTFFSPRTLRALLGKRGFEVLEVYFPTRWMTLRHLFGRWGRWLLGRPPAPITHRVSCLQRLVLPLNLGDIFAVIGRKGC